MRKLFLFIILSSAFNQAVLAQEAPTEETEPTPTMTATEKSHRAISNWSLGLSVLQWNETLKLQQSPLSANDFANYNALAVTAQTEKTYLHWGWNAGVFIGAGGAAGGGNNSVISYQKSKVPFTVYGISPRIFYRVSGRINVGLSALAFMKNVDWPKDVATQTIDSGNKFNAMAMADLNIRLFRSWDFYTGIGPMAENSTLWKIGLNYRF